MESFHINCSATCRLVIQIDPLTFFPSLLRFFLFFSFPCSDCFFPFFYNKILRFYWLNQFYCKSWLNNFLNRFLFLFVSLSIFSLVASYWVFTQMRKPIRRSSPKSLRVSMHKPTDSCWNWLNCKYFPFCFFFVLCTHKCKTALGRPTQRNAITIIHWYWIFFPVFLFLNISNKQTTTSHLICSCPFRA